MTQISKEQDLLNKLIPDSQYTKEVIKREDGFEGIKSQRDEYVPIVFYNVPEVLLICTR